MNAFKRQKRHFPEEKHLFAKILFYFYIKSVYRCEDICGN